jgi:LEA14-like dessication related protein
MKKNKTISIVLLVLLMLFLAVFIYLWVNYSNRKKHGENAGFIKPSIKSSSVRIRSFSKQRTEMSVLVKFDNPIPVGLTIDSLYYELKIAGREVMKNYHSVSNTVKGNDSGYVVIPLTIDNDRLQKTLEALRKLGVDSVEYKMDMKLYPKLPLMKGKPINYSYKIKGPLIIAPGLKVERLKIHKTGLKTSDMAITLKVINHNVFPLAFLNPHYEMKLDNEHVASGKYNGLINIPPRGEKSFDVPVKLKTGAALKKGIRSLLKPDKTSYYFFFEAVMPELPLGDNINLILEVEDNHLPVEFIK